MRLPLVLCAALLAAAPAFANETAESPARVANAPRIGNMDTAQFLAFHAEIRRDVASGQYAKLDRRDRAMIDEQEAVIAAKLDHGRTFAQLDERGRLAVFNAHQRVVGILNGEEEDDVICRKEHQVGSHRPRVVCLSERDRELAAQQNKLTHIHKGASID